MRVGLIALAGAAGALARYGIGQAVGPRTFPWATLAINVAGALALGFVLAGPIAARWPADITAAITVGFLGAFTTFSTFAYEATALLPRRPPRRRLRLRRQLAGDRARRVGARLRPRPRGHLSRDDLSVPIGPIGPVRADGPAPGSAQTAAASWARTPSGVSCGAWHA